MKFLSIAVLLFAGTQGAVSQEVASNFNENRQINTFDVFDISEPAEEIEETKKTETYDASNALLSEGAYTFDNGDKKISVEIKDGYYTEHYANNEFIKAKINWTSKSEYNLVITEIQKKNLPFVAGTIMHTKIVRVKGNRYYYMSSLKGLTWEGKFVKTAK
jgi:hypothetical protein